MTSQRIAIYDALKGFSILWIVAFHLPAFEQCAALRVYYAVPLFFILSGVFFREVAFLPFLAKKAKRLLWPFTVFYLVAYGAYMLAGVVKGASPYSWGEPMALLDLFNLHNPIPTSPLAINYPLWFLLVLFNVSLLYYGIAKITRSPIWRLVAAGGCYAMSVWLDNCGVNGLFFLSLTLRYIFFFAIGQTFAPRFVEWVSTTKYKWWILVGMIAMLAACTVGDHEGLLPVLFVVRVLLFGAVAAMVIGYLIGQLDWLKRGLCFFGVQSIVVLGLHTVIMWGLLSFGFAGGAWGAWLIWAVDCALCAATAVVINKYMPWILGINNK